MTTPYLNNTGFGASVVPMQQRTHEDGQLQAPQLPDSPALTPAGSHEDMSREYMEKPVPPHSPFYQHPPASSERVSGRQNSKVGAEAYEKDLESGHLTPFNAAEDTNPFTSKISVDHNQECKMWPSRQTLMRQKTQEKTKQRQLKGFAVLAPLRERWAAFDKRQQLYIKIAIAFLLVGIAVALGVGISKAVHGTYYGKNGKQETVGNS